VSEPDRIVELWRFRDPTVELAISMTQVEDVRREGETLDDVAGTNHGGSGVLPLTVDGQPMATVIAAYMPAGRATRIDPMQALPNPPVLPSTRPTD